MINHREVLRLHSKKLNQTTIAASIPCSRATVSRTLKRAEEKGLTWEAARSMTTEEVSECLYHIKRNDAVPGERVTEYLDPDFESIRREYTESDVTIQMLWSEYAGKARAAGKQAYSYAHFWRLLREYCTFNTITKRNGHYPGEAMMVDWAGTPVYYKDQATGGNVPCNLFVAVLPYSQYTFAEVMPCMTQEFWLRGHAHAFEFFGGVTKMVVADNFWARKKRIACGTVEPDRTYTEFAEYYDTALVCVRAYRPQERACIERTVRTLNIEVTTALCDEQLYSLHELNTAVRFVVRKINRRPLVNYAGTPYGLFEHMEKDALHALPEKPYEP